MLNTQAVCTILALSFATPACLEAPLSKDTPAPTEEQAAVTACAEGTVVEGIDLSEWQGLEVDWDAIAASKYEFAFLRVSDGLSYPDDAFDRNWSEARRVGVLRGAYQYFHPGQDVAAQAEYLLEKMGDLQPGDLPPVIDVEATDGLSGTVIASAVDEWIEVVETATGVRPIIYSGRYFWDDNVGSDAFGDYPYWLPAYFSTYTGNCPSTAAPWERWDFWQWTDSGTVPGVPGGVDSNVFNGSLDDLLALTVDDADPDTQSEPASDTNSDETDGPSNSDETDGPSNSDEPMDSGSDSPSDPDEPTDQPGSADTDQCGAPEDEGALLVDTASCRFSPRATVWSLASLLASSFSRWPL